MPKAGGAGKKGGLRVFWLPTGHKSHKHKKNKYYVRDNLESPTSAMMSGDSPNSHGKDYFDFKEGRTTPPATTSKDISVQSSSGAAADVKTDVVTASVLADPLKEHGPGTNCVGLLDGQSENKRGGEDDIVATEEKKPLKDDDRSDAQKKSGEKDVPKKANGTVDKLDGNLAALSDARKEEEDESCAVKCLYYTLQCCECTLM